MVPHVCSGNMPHVTPFHWGMPAASAYLLDRSQNNGLRACLPACLPACPGWGLGLAAFTRGCPPPPPSPPALLRLLSGEGVVTGQRGATRGSESGSG